MIAVSDEYKRQLIAGNRNYVVKIPVYLSGNTSNTPDFTLTNEDIWEQGVVVDSATSSDSSFDLGAAVVGGLKVVIDNITGEYSTYDFYSAKLVLYLGVTGDVNENDEQIYYRIGFYTVDAPSYNGSLITLDCLDNMTWFDTPFSDVTGVSYPTTAGSLVAAICSHVGVTLGTVTFPNYTTAITVEPDSKLNCREVLQYVAQMCCCYCKIDTAGELILAWYDKTAITGLTNYDGGTYNTTTTPYSDGDSLDGGNFTDYTSGDSVDGGTFAELNSGAYLSQNYQMEVSTDDIVVTGCRVRNSRSSEDGAYDELYYDATIEQTHPRYVLVIEDNPFITPTNAATIANQVGNILAGLPIRAYTATSLSDFSYETGDMVRFYDFRGNRSYSWITKFTFTINNSEQFSCGAESIRKRSETRFSGLAKTLAEAQDNAQDLISDYDNAVKAMNELAQNAIGYNNYQYTVSGSTVTWLYNGSNIDTTDPEHPLFPNSTVVFKISGDGVFISNDGGETYTQGYDANSGTAILSLIYAIGINCDWIHAGTLTLGGTDNVNGLCTVLDHNGDEKVRMDVNGLNATDGRIIGGLIDGATIRSWSGATQTARDSVTITGGSLTVYNTKNNYLSVKHISGNGTFALGGTNCAGYNNSVYYGNDEKPCPPWGICKAGYEASSGSDIRLKEKISEITQEYAENLIYNLKPVEYYYKNNGEYLRYGLIAQDVRGVLDNMGEERTVYMQHTDGDYETVEYKELIAPLIKTVQMQKEEIDLLKQELAELKARVK